MKGHRIETLEDFARKGRVFVYGIGSEGGSAKVGVAETLEIRPGVEIRYRLDACWKNREGTLAWESLLSLHTLDVDEAPAASPSTPLFIRSLHGSELYVGLVTILERSPDGLVCYHTDRAGRAAYFFYPWHVILRLGRERFGEPASLPPLPAPEPEDEPEIGTVTVAELEEVTIDSFGVY
jgi:hypothetical protein